MIECVKKKAFFFPRRTKFEETIERASNERSAVPLFCWLALTKKIAWKAFDGLEGVEHLWTSNIGDCDDDNDLVTRSLAWSKAWPLSGVGSVVA